MDIIGVIFSKENKEGFKVEKKLINEKENEKENLLIDYLNNELLKTSGNVVIDNTTISKYQGYIIYTTSFLKSNGKGRDLTYCLHIISKENYSILNKVSQDIAKIIQQYNLFDELLFVLTSIFPSLIIEEINPIKINVRDKDYSLTGKEEKKFEGLF